MRNFSISIHIFFYDICVYEVVNKKKSFSFKSSIKCKKKNRKNYEGEMIKEMIKNEKNFPLCGKFIEIYFRLFHTN
jgi:hypothetical protein